MKKIIVSLLVTFMLFSCDFSNYILTEDYDFTTVFEKSQGEETATYPQVISYYEDLASAYPSIQLKEMGKTDSGLPLHLAIFNPEADFNLKNLQKDHSILLILNGIHPGESDGIDATMLLFRDLAQDSIEVPKNTIIATIPVYNIGGALNRNSHSRANQNGPSSYGFRGNARDFDLNRDFIKADTKNARAFYEIFHYLNPDVFIDNHVSNGADYQYSLTHLFTQHDKLDGELGNYLNSRMMPALTDSLKKKNLEITPYVNVFNEIPEKGFSQFLDYPRYSTGYTTLWNSLGMMVETHMLKPYKDRVWGTYELLRSMISITDTDTDLIKDMRERAFYNFQQKKTYSFQFVPDSTKPSTLEFLGYEAERIQSEVTGLERLKYDRSKPFEKEVAYYNNFKPTREVSIPKAYIIPKAWEKILDRFRWNDIEMTEFTQDSSIQVEVYHIQDFETVGSPFEGHYLHSKTQVSSSKTKMKIQKGDFLVPTEQPGIRYILATLEPEAPDSFFNWNFFDSVLQQKEHFSSYVFEDLAQEILKENPEIETEFHEKQQQDPNFKNDWHAQLEWIYKKSPYYEKAHLQYPIFRVLR